MAAAIFLDLRLLARVELVRGVAERFLWSRNGSSEEVGASKRGWQLPGGGPFLRDVRCWHGFQSLPLGLTLVWKRCFALLEDRL
jgi:hypothetical protein